MVVIPTMVRLAPRLKMIDMPDPRKVHAIPVARVGGWGITLGALLPFVLASPMDPVISTYVFGAVVLMVFGTLDDCFEMGHYPKFIGQFLATIPLVYYGGLYVERFPFMGPELLPPEIGKPFTVFALVGMINAINHSDGLDGLAGGESFLSLIVISLLAFLYIDGAAAGAQLAESPDMFYAVILLVLAMAVIGGLLGFLRFNTHPARVFMGDNGSQFLGFTLGFMAVLLTQRINTGLTPALPALLLGLPIVDILAVFYLRISGGMNWFKATRNHVHHRLLDLGFVHSESVVIIYSVQAFFVTCAVILRYAPDWLVLAVYLGGCGALFALITAAERRGWRASSLKSRFRLEGYLTWLESLPTLRNLPLLLVTVGIPVYFVGSCASLSMVPTDFGVLSLVLLVALGVEVLRSTRGSVLGRLIVYSTAMFVVYLSLTPGPRAELPLVIDHAFFVVLAVCVAIAMRSAGDGEFRITPMDYLIVFIMLGVGLVSLSFDQVRVNTALIIKAIIILYACELILSRAQRGWAVISMTVLATLAVLTLRG
ncbi:MAG: undecaprenyl/decaprenyl-phosphate alpha-N-acetylglucosaminyl 1-phosphate transferase, partial [Gammaproteobacteria bacterium]|nr:undecaprenyl/decaprenyl-phosphate alpha-N-acetylglucosaminyl 1-phosphate transferase [Gammaproteobacteria bacterium]